MKGLYSIFDRGIGKYLLPFPAETDHEAIRQCKTVVNDKRESNITLYPEDYDLYFIGWFKDDQAKLIPAEPNYLVVKLSDLKEVKK